MTIDKFKRLLDDAATFSNVTDDFEGRDVLLKLMDALDKDDMFRYKISQIIK